MDWLHANSLGFTEKNWWPPNFPDLHPLGYHVLSTMLEKYQKRPPKRTTIDKLKVALQTIWKEMPQEQINKVVANFTKRLTACVTASGGQFEHLQ